MSRFDAALLLYISDILRRSYYFFFTYASFFVSYLFVYLRTVK